MLSSLCEVNLLTEDNYLKNRICILNAKSDWLRWLHCTAKFPRLSQQKGGLGSVSNVCHRYGRGALRRMPKIWDLIILRINNKQTNNSVSQSHPFLSCCIFCFCIWLLLLFLGEIYFEISPILAQIRRSGDFLWQAGEAWWGWQGQLLKQGTDLERKWLVALKEHLGKLSPKGGDSWSPAEGLYTKKTAHLRLCVKSPGPKGAYIPTQDMGCEVVWTISGGLTSKSKQQWTLHQ